LIYQGKNPLKDYSFFEAPREQNVKLVLRSLCGHGCLYLILTGLTLSPLLIVLIVFQMNPFWTGFLGAYINNEHMAH
jgi:hypothetical protein